MNNEARIAELNAANKSLLGKGSRFNQLENAAIVRDLTDSEQAERQQILAQVEAVAAELNELNAPAMQRTMNSLIAD